MAAGSFPGAAAWELSPSGGPRRRRWAVPRPEDESDEEPAVLLLSHFSRPPYLSFGRLRVGASRTRLLGIENPNAEDAEVVVERFPASARGFSLERRRFCVESQQRIFVYVTWTPLEEGKVRELVTFVINGIVKHQAVLLGVAEQPLKKKKSLWDTIKKKNVSETSASRKINKRNSKVKNVNKTFQVSQKADRLRSPLQSCENQDAVQNSTSPVKESPGGSENKLPISPIAPVLEELRTTACTPLSMRRSTTFSDIAAAVNEGLLPEMDSLNFNKLVDDHNELKSGSAYNSSGLEKPPVSNSEVFLDCTLSPVCTPEHSSSVPFISTRRFLSPESFVRDNYQADGGTVEPSIPILSPDQFVKDMQLYMQLKTPKPEATLISSTTETYVVKECVPSKWKKNAGRQTKTQVHVERVLHEAFQVHSVDSQVLHCNKPKENHLSCPPVEEFQIHSAQTKQPKKRPVLSATVVKNKRGAGERKKMEMLQSKSKKCLNSAIMACENVGPVHTKADISERLPVIGPASAGNECPGDKVSSSAASASLCRKRKNEAYMEKIRAVGSVHVEEVERKRALTLSVDSKTHTAVRPSAFKHTARERTGQRKKPGSSLQKASKTTNRISKPVAGLAQSHLVFVKPLKTAIPRHPMPFAAKNMFYDERWKEKQQRGFTWWLNFVLTPDDFSVKTNTSQVNAAALILGEETHHKTSVPKAPTKEEVSLKAYTARRKLNKLRRDACRLFTSEAMVKAIKKLEVEIETRRLLVRRDRHLWKDVGERQKILNWLLSYNPLWLRIGLETVYGELITLESNSDFMGLAVFILNRLLWNPDIAAEYRHPTVPHLYREGHEEALSKFTLKKLLLLVCFLDRAKQSRLIGHDPCLFCKDAEFKTSKDILLAISRDFLSGEGDLSRHLGFLGLPVSHIQTPLDEFDFAVTNLAVDLQCGIRLVRAMELLTNDWNLSKQLRVPAISRLQKMHNVDIVLNVLKERGIHLKDESGASIDCRDIVDRHRERTLALLWKIAFAFQVDVLLDVEQLKEEIKFLKNAHKMKMQLGALKLFSSCCGVQEDSSGSPSPQNHSENVKLLMAWVNAVCGFYNIKVENFTVCFSDGRVLCHLIHHYHPCYMPLEAVCQRTTQTVECSRTHKVGLNCSSSSSSESDTSLNVMEGTFDQTVTASAFYKELLENEKKNFQLINTAVSDLGGIPAMIHHSDMSNTIPDEKVVITYLSFLCSRLLDLRQETRAARLIQSAWRKYRLKRELKLSQAYWRRYSARKSYLQLRHYVIFVQARIRMLLSVAAYKRILWATVTIQNRLRASKLAKEHRQRYEILRSSALTIQSAFRKWRKHRTEEKIRAALVLQSYFRRWQSSKLAKIKRAALVIQSWYRMHRDRKQYLHIKRSIIKIQAWYRCQIARRIYQEYRAQIVTIQQYYRAYKLGKKERENYVQKRAAAVVLQAAFRGKRARILYRQTKAACVVQSLWRMRQAKLRFLLLKKSVTILQSHVRKYQQVKRYKEMKNAASAIQAWYRAIVASKKAASSFQRMRLAAVVLQSAYRGRKARKEAHILRSVIKIQSSYRAYVTQKRFKNLRNAAVKIQAFVKMRLARRYYCALREAMLFVQQRYRSQRYALQIKEDYRKLKGACIKIQAGVRGYFVRKQIKKWREAAIFLQAQYRMRRTRAHYLAIYSAAVVIQKHYRAYHKQVRQRQEFLQVKKAAVCIQAAYRGYNTRKKLKLKHRAAVKIQTAFRAHAARSKYQAMIQASVVIQRWYRTCKTSNRQRLTFLMTRAAVLTLQAAFRGYQVRKQIRRQHAAATAIQSAFRKFMALKTFRLRNDAALIIQRRYRASVISQKQRQEYVELRNCVVRLQAIWRGKAVRKEIQKKHSLATIIQSYYRMHVNRLKFKKLRQSTLVIQRYFKAYCLKEKQRAHYLKTKAAVLVLQSAYRGMTVRKQLRELRRAATIIQAAFRSYLVKKNYVKLRSAAVVIQRRYRAVIHTKWQRQKYLSLKAAAVKMQAIYRGVKVRRQIHSMHQAAICIQAVFKMHRINIRYQAIRMAAIIIQRQYRAICLGRAQRKKYLELKKSSIVLQAAFRGRKVRRDLKVMHQSAALIQSYYRMHKQQRDFRNLLLATRRIQQWYRACKERNKQVHNYVTLRSAALCLQAAFRGMKTRRLLRTMNESAELIQRRFRTFLRRKHFISLRTAAIVIQRKYRATKLAKIQRQKYLSLLNAAVIIQSAYRGFVVRQKVRQMHQAAKVIQATLRMRKIYISYQALRLASVIIQQRYRAYREGKRVREMYLKLYNSVLVLQAAYRGMKTRCFLKKRHEAALTIQRNYRMYRQYRHYRRVQWATQLIQRRYRANSQRNIAVRRYSSFRKAAICIQRAFREMRVKKQHRKMHRAATVVQKNYKAFRERQRFLSLKAAALVFQRRYRALILSRHHTQEYLRLRSAAVRIQAVYRGIRVRRSIEHMHLAACTIQSAYKMHRSRRAYQKLRAAAIVIQNYYRSYLEVKNQQKKYLMIKKSALLIQAYYRGTKERQRLKTMHASAIVIQSSYRMYIQRKYYKQLCWAVRVIQQRFRAKTAKVADMENYAKIRKAIICLQSSFRAKKARQLYKANAAALCIQSFIRMHVERKRFLVKKAAAITIQSAFRGQRARSRYKSIQRSIVAIQRWYRACHRARLQKAEYSVQRQAIIIIQSAYRGMKARKLARQTRATRRIQSFLQMAVQRRKFIRLKRAAITLQAYYFMRKTKSQYASCKKAAVVLQRWYRSHLIVKRQRVIYLQTLEKIIVVQAIVRRFIVKKRFQKIKESTIKIQAHFRGFTQRRRYLQCKFAALVIQQRYRACLMRNAERQRFNQKKRAAIRIQSQQRIFVYVTWTPLEEGKVRELVTFVINGIVKHQAVLLGVAEQPLKKKIGDLGHGKGGVLSSQILEQKQKKRLLYFMAAAYHHVSAIKIQRAYRMHLTYKLAENHISSVIIIQEIRSMPRVVTCIQSLYKLTARKCKMDAERMLMKQKTNTLISGTSLVPVTPLRIKTVSRIKPDWVLRKDNMQEIVDPLQAIVMVMDTLGIACY
ncbi:UNVERIFIED_CONTAM: hypothetical protein H355_007065 [Colinus virginianus]|nr:hypothetical protein H355_007065 [Colinus virginianus]